SEAFALLRRHATPFLADHLARCAADIRRGVEPAFAMNTGLFGNEVMRRLQNYQRNQRFEAMLEQMGGQQIDKSLKAVERGVRRGTAIFKLGFAVFLVGIVLNTYGIQDAIRASL